MTSRLSASGYRRGIIFVLVIAMASVYIFRLMQLQIFERSVFEEKAAMNSIKAIEDVPLRGVFYDRNLKLLVENTPTYTVRITPAEYKKTSDSLLEAVLNIPSGAIRSILQKNKQYSKFTPVKIKRGVDFASIGWIEENSEKLVGVSYIIEMQRGYRDSIMASHLYGYTKEISPKRLETDTSKYYSPGDLVGYNGIERKYESLLRGIKGYKYVVVDAKQREVSNFQHTLKNIPAIKGKDLVLSIDADAQRVAEKELQGFTGAVVAIEPATGEVLAMASSPSYNLNEFSYFTPKQYITQLYTDPSKPLFNRATMAAHPPGSTFKVLCAITALEAGLIDETYTYSCGGGFTYGRFFKCHTAHGPLNVIHAIEKSCNTFFYALIFKNGLERLAAMAAKFGLGRKTGVDIMEESAGLIPTEKYYEKIYGKNWPRGIMVSLGIGQGEISVTPMQLAFYAGLIANNGKSHQPHVVKGYLNDDKKFVPMGFPEVNTGVSQKTFDIVKQGMYLVVNGAGTATNIKSAELQIAGKTGTAQNPHGKDHSVFICFAPFDHPKIAVAVLVENAGFGATYAAPIAQKVLSAYLKVKTSTTSGVVAETGAD